MSLKACRTLPKSLLFTTTALFFSLCLSLVMPGTGQSAGSAAPKYIFIFVADGAGITQLELTRLYSQHAHKEGLVITDRIFGEGSFGLITTHSADSLITDSAAAATALAIGCKAKNGAIGTCADGSARKTVFEIGKDKGMRLGLITNAEIYDATPAAFSTHPQSRRHYSSIIDQYLNLEPDLLMGGGRDYFLPQSQPGSRRNDRKDMITLFRERGYSYVTNKDELMAARGPKLLGLFGLGPMSFEGDRNSKIEPSIYDMTQAALRILRANLERGFLILIENENIDSAGHRSELVSLVRDFKELDRAVGLGYEFYRQYPDVTLILVISDHETGGLTLTQSKKKSLPSFKRDPLSEIVGPQRAKNFEAQWSTSGHTNQPVFIGALGVGAERFRGYQDNTDVARHLFALIGGAKSR